jgi:hypothetical protein
VVRTLVLALVVAACGGGRERTVARPQPDKPLAGDALAVEPPPSEAECDALIARAVALGAADRKATDDEQTRVRGELRGRYIAICRDMSRRVYACALAASSLDALESCDHPTRSSSTSNSSVEPGGITPGTPRAP